MKVPNLTLGKHLFVLQAIAITTGCATVEQQTGPMIVSEIHQAFGRYLGTPNTR